MCSVQCAVFTVECAMCSVKLTLCIVQYEVFIVCVVYNVQSECVVSSEQLVF